MGANYNRDDVCYVYAIGIRGEEWGALDGALKIGVAHDPEGRLNALQTGCPARLSIQKLWKFRCEMDAREFEVACHKEFSQVNLMREWFSITVDAIDAFLVAFKSACADREEMDDLAALLSRAREAAASIAATKAYQERQISKLPAYGVVDAQAKPVDPRRMTSQQAAAYLGKSASWLNQSRCRGDGPVYFKLGANVFYDTKDLDIWMTSKRRVAVYDFNNNVPA